MQSTLKIHASDKITADKGTLKYTNVVVTHPQKFNKMNKNYHF